MVAQADNPGDELVGALRDLQRVVARPSPLQQKIEQGQSIVDSLRQLREESAENLRRIREESFSRELRLHQAIETVCESISMLAERITVLEDFVAGTPQRSEDESPVT